jgi:hypothetical protein
MARQKYVYKVVARWNHEARTGFSAVTKPPLGLHYGFGKPTKASLKTAGVFVFARYEDALSYATRGRASEFAKQLAILKCEYIGTVAAPEHVKILPAVILESLGTKQGVYHAIKRGTHVPLGAWAFPNGTYCVESVTPVSVKWVQDRI